MNADAWDEWGSGRPETHLESRHSCAHTACRITSEIQANASLAANRTYETLAKELEKAATALDKLKAQCLPIRKG